MLTELGMSLARNGLAVIDMDWQTMSDKSQMDMCSAMEGMDSAKGMVREQCLKLLR